MDLRQYAAHGSGTGPTKPNSVTVHVGQPTLQGSLLVLVAVAGHDDHRTYRLDVDPGWGAPVFRRVQGGDLTVAVWRWENAPRITGATVVNGSNRSTQAMLFEITGAAQGAALDEVAVQTGRSSQPRSGQTGTLAQGDEAVLGFIANQCSSTTQGGFAGGLTEIVEKATPVGDAFDSDNQRSRLSAHLALTTTATSWELRGNLSTVRDWVAAVVTFKGGSVGPALLTSIGQPDAVSFTGGSAELHVFGPLTSTDMGDAVTFDGGSAWIGPGNLQMRLGGPDGLLIGSGTRYRIGKVTGLGGHDVRTSDTEFPRGDGSVRSEDFQASRMIMLEELNWDDPDPDILEHLTQALVAALTPRREDDFDLLFRRPGRPLQVVRCRPISLSDELDAVQMLLRSKTVALLAADPRIYGARVRSVEVPVTPAGTDIPAAVAAPNAGNARAHPTIRIDNRGSVDVTGIALVNATGDVAFEVAATIPPGGQLVGDMPAHVTAAPRSVITIDGQSRYGAWAAPREPFFLAPAPQAPGGDNAVHLRTTPAGASVHAVLEYRDTSAS